MKKMILITLVALVIGTFCVALGVLNYKPDLYKNMVKASVKLSGHGSGVFIDDDVILTAAHCLEGVKIITIELSDGTILKSGDFYIDDKEDIAFIFVTVDELHVAKVSSTSVNIGDTVYLVGRPFDDMIKFSLTKGILSHLDRNIFAWNWKNLLQTDAEGGPGSSGGPLYNANGELVGMYVGHIGGGGRGISLCESAKSILEAYERYINKRKAG